MSRVLQPFGRVVKRIVIESDEKGLIRVDAKTIGFVPNLANVVGKTPMDLREMVVALLKVALDYSIVLFSGVRLEGGKANGETDNHENNDQ
jgi:hypothetical protein